MLQMGRKGRSQSRKVSGFGVLFIWVEFLDKQNYGAKVKPLVKSITSNHSILLLIDMKKQITLLTLLLLLTGALSAQNARVQVVHNSADAAAATVDVWLTVPIAGSTRLFDDVAFRTAEAFVDAPAGIPLSVGIAPGTSTSVNDTIRNFDLTLAANTNYIVVAEGIVSASGYSPAEPFGLSIYALGQESSTNPGKTDVLVHHGATDAPAVDVVEVGQTASLRLVDGASYTDFTSYIELDPLDYELQVRTDDCDITVAQFGAPLQTLGLADSAVLVLASGFLNPANNSNGPAFGLFAVLPSGGPFVPLPVSSISTARAHVIHNSADLAADTVDVWFNDEPLLVDFAFRTSSPFIDVPAGSDFDISIQPKGSADTIGALARYTYNLMGGEKYILVANGQVSGSGYTPATPFDIDVYAGARECASMPGNTDLLVYHGATDAPTVDVDETSVPLGTFVDDISYSEFQGYAELPTADYSVDVRDGANTVTVASYQAPLAALNLDDLALTVLASGFLDPGANSNGAGFGLWVSLPGGGDLVELPIIVGVEDELNNIDYAIFPNPAENSLNIRYESPVNEEATINILDLNGSVVMSQSYLVTAGAQELNIDIQEVPAGMYLLQLQQGNIRLNQKVQIIH